MDALIDSHPDPWNQTGISAAELKPAPVRGSRWNSWPSAVESSAGAGLPPPDIALVERVLRGEEEAFRILYERYDRAVRATACRILRDREEAADAVQEIFIKVFRSLASWNPEKARFSTWLFRLSANHAVDCWRMKRRRLESRQADGEDTRLYGSEWPAGRAGETERGLERREAAAAVWRWVRKLPQPQRRFFVLRHLRELTLREIAETEGYRLGTVKTSLHRATQNLRQRLERRQSDARRCSAGSDPLAHRIPA